MKIYLAARFQNKPLLQYWREMLDAAGHEITSRWLDGDPKSVEDNAVMDLEDVASADMLILYIDTPAEGERPMQGAWTEFGYAYGLGKRIVVIGADKTKSIFVQLPGLWKVDSWDKAFDCVETIVHFEERDLPALQRAQRRSALLQNTGGTVQAGPPHIHHLPQSQNH